MGKPNDDLKLDINEIFGAIWTETEPLPEPPLAEPPTALPEVSEGVQGSEIKFNDLANAPVVEPMVITLRTKVHRMVSEDAPPSDSADTQNSEPEESKPSEETNSSLVLKPGTSGDREPNTEDLFVTYDHFRKIFLTELKDTAGIRKTSIMLVKTFEVAREKHPEVFRNANWDADGNLLEDGSLNIQRMLDNKLALDQKQADIILDTALIALLNFRLQAVEKGLGPEFTGKLKATLKRWIDEESQKNTYKGNHPKVLSRLSYFLL